MLCLLPGMECVHTWRCGRVNTRCYPLSKTMTAWDSTCHRNTRLVWWSLVVHIHDYSQVYVVLSAYLLWSRLLFKLSMFLINITSIWHSLRVSRQLFVKFNLLTLFEYHLVIVSHLITCTFRLQIILPVNIHLVGDVCVYVYHARKMMGKVIGVKVAQLQFHTGFIPEEDTSLRFTLWVEVWVCVCVYVCVWSFHDCFPVCDTSLLFLSLLFILFLRLPTRHELDDVTEPERYPEKFTITVNIFVSDVDRTPPQQPIWATRLPSTFKPHTAFSTAIEMEETREKFGVYWCTYGGG